MDEEDPFETCKSCRFYEKHQYENLDVIADYGQCRRYPPRRVAENMSVFPIVIDDCWCGEYQEKM
jgi:hypothetical protein